MTDGEFEKAIDICEKLDFFGGCRAGRELWFGKPADVQDIDIQKFAEDVAFLKDFINRQKAELEKTGEKWAELYADTVTKWEEAYEELEADVDKQYEQAKADILGNMADGGTSCHWCINQHRAEAVREFVERLLERVAVKTLVGKSEYYSDGFIEATCWYDEEIDNLVKEMTEEAEL